MSEIVAETSEASKDQSESATGENSMCMCRMGNLISVENATFQCENCLAML